MICGTVDIVVSIADQDRLRQVDSAGSEVVERATEHIGLRVVRVGFAGWRRAPQRRDR